MVNLVRYTLRTTLCSLTMRTAHQWSGAWERRLKNLRRAEGIAGQLDRSNILGYPVAEGKKVLLKEVKAWKEAHPEMIVLVRVGEFYETWGLDAVALVEYAGLNPMGGKARAGCPIKNVQQTLDALTTEGFSVAVYEEEESQKTPKKRSLAQIVSPGRPIYVAHDSALSSVQISDFDSALPYAAVQLYQNTHYRVALFDVDARLATIAEEVTEDGARSILNACSGIYYTSQTQKFVASLNEDVHHDYILENDVKSAKELALKLVSQVCTQLEIAPHLTEKELRFQRMTRPPVLAQTAREIGIPLKTRTLPDLEVPPLLESTNSEWLRKWLLTSPSFKAATAMRSIQATLRTKATVPRLPRPPSRRKMVRLLADGEASAALMRDIAITTEAAADLIHQDTQLEIVDNILDILKEDTSIAQFDAPRLAKAALTAAERIRAAIVFTATPASSSPDETTEGTVLDAFFYKNEHLFRASVLETRMPKEVQSLREAADELRLAADEIVHLGELSFDLINNIIALKSVKKEDEHRLISPLDRYRRPLAKRWTSERLEAAVGNYVKRCDICATAARKALRELSRDLYCDHIDALLCSASLVEATDAAIEHSRFAARRGWCLPEIAQDGHLKFEGLVPYWLEMGRCVSNDVILKSGDSAILTGPNAAGKSTLLRSVAAATLLAARGLCCPARSASLPKHIDSIFLRAASRGDAPSLGKSAFAREMDDVALLFRESRADSTVILVDEIGKGTSPTEAAALGSAILSEFTKRHFRAIFATHLHREIAPILDSDHPRWQMHNYELVPGVCADSLALDCAHDSGVPQSIIERAAALLNTPSPLPKEDHSKNVLHLVTNELATFSIEESRRVYSITPKEKALLFNSCLYVLNLGDRVYVGETDDLESRLKKHRKKGALWRNADALFVIVQDKTSARRCETLLIRRLADMGIPLESTADANRRLTAPFHQPEPVFPSSDSVDCTHNSSSSSSSLGG